MFGTSPCLEHLNCSIHKPSFFRCLFVKNYLNHTRNKHSLFTYLPCLSKEDTSTDTGHSLASISCFKTRNIWDKSHSSISKFRAINSIISGGSFSFINGVRVYHMNLGRPLNFLNFEHYFSTCQLSLVNQKHYIVHTFHRMET